MIEYSWKIFNKNKIISLEYNPKKFIVMRGAFS